MKTFKAPYLGLAACLGLCLGTNLVFAQTYTLNDVDSTRQTTAYAINDSGYVGGETRDRASYSNVVFGLAGYIADLRVLPERSFSFINDLNKGMLAVGGTRIDFGPSIATLFTYDHETITIGGLPGDVVSQALAVSDAGWVVGYSYGGASHRDRAFLWVPDGGDITRIGAMYELPCKNANAKAMAINKDGLIGGYCGEKPYLWSHGVGYDISSWLPARVDVGRGLVARTSADLGHCEVNSIANSYAFSVYCDARAAMGISFVSTPVFPALTQVPGLGLRDGLSSQAHINSINNDGCAVGSAGYNVAIKYCDSVLTDLNRVVIPGSVDLREATDINNFGQILVWRFVPSFGLTRPVVLTPR